VKLYIASESVERRPEFHTPHVGEITVHPVYGIGKVRKVEKMWKGTEITIDYADCHRKILFESSNIRITKQ
jgi:hypothetical protein